MIRIPAFYESYYKQLLANKNLCETLLMQFKLLLVMRKGSPLAGCAGYYAGYAAPFYGGGARRSQESIPDNGPYRSNPAGHAAPEDYVYDRGSQIDLLKTLPGSYMWASPVPADILEDAGMIQRTASMSRVYNLDLLIWRKNSPGSSLVRSFADYLQKYAGELAGEWGE